MSGISDPNTILMTAVLSMDVYDRDQDLSSPEIRGMLDSDLGDATLIEAPTYDVNTLFGAAAWNFNGNVIIAYRGTVSSSFGNFYTEAENGYGVGAGKPFGPQATQAIQFYQQIADLSDTSYSNSGIILTGHSLGGGLAGFVGAIYGQQGELFDNMPFESAADNAYRAAAGLTDVYFPPAGFSNTVYGTGVKPYVYQLGGLSGYHVSGEVLTPLRAFQTTPSIALLSDTSGPTDPVDYHSQALLVMALWAQDESKTSWKAASEQFYSALFTSEATNVASALGLTGGSADLLTEIAYSALGMLSSDNLPFGSTAIQSLFSDADIIGSLKTDGDFSGALADTSPSSGNSENGGYLGNGSAPSPADALMEIAVQFAGDQAAAGNTDPEPNTGALKLKSGALSVDLNPQDWLTTYGDGQHQIIGVSDLIQGVLYNVLGIDSTTTVGGTKAENAINNFVTDDRLSDIEIAVTSGVSLDSTSAPISVDSEPANTVLIGQASSGAIKAGDGNNLVFGGQTVTVGNGDNIIVGEAGGETITVGGGNNVVIASGSGNTINIEASASDPKSPGINFLYAGNGAENINIDSGNGEAGVIVDPATMTFTNHGILG